MANRRLDIATSIIWVFAFGDGRLHIMESWFQHHHHRFVVLNSSSTTVILDFLRRVRGKRQVVALSSCVFEYIDD